MNAYPRSYIQSSHEAQGQVYRDRMLGDKVKLIDGPLFTEVHSYEF